MPDLAHKMPKADDREKGSNGRTLSSKAGAVVPTLVIFWLAERFATGRMLTEWTAPSLMRRSSSTQGKREGAQLLDARSSWSKILGSQSVSGHRHTHRTQRHGKVDSHQEKHREIKSGFRGLDQR